MVSFYQGEDPEKMVWRPLSDFEAYMPERYRNASEAVKNSSHWGSDYFIVEDFIEAVRGKRPPAVDVYEACEWTAVGLLSAIDVYKRQVLGSGTALDTARLRYLLGEHFSVDPRNMHAYVIGEHGDSEFVPWSQAMMATRPLLETCEDGSFTQEDMDRITEEVRGAAQIIIASKRATYYGIGMALVRITRAIFGNEHSVLTVSAMLRGEYGESGVFVGVPCIVNRNGIQKVLPLSLNADEEALFKHSCQTLKSCYESLNLNY